MLGSRASQGRICADSVAVMVFEANYVHADHNPDHFGHACGLEMVQTPFGMNHDFSAGWKSAAVHKLRANIFLPAAVRDLDDSVLLHAEVCRVHMLVALLMDCISQHILLEGISCCRCWWISVFHGVHAVSNHSSEGIRFMADTG